MGPLLDAAVRNNAAWCGRVCAAHGHVSRTGDAVWSCPDHVLPFYPHLITLRPDCGQAQLDAVRAGRPRSGRWGVKDSFANLDLSTLGFRRAIAGRWVRYAPTPGPQSLDWRPVTDPVEIAAWETAWGGPAHDGQRRLFGPSLLADGAVVLFAGYAGGRPAAGGVISLDAGVAGLSNLFGEAPEWRREAIAAAEGLAGGQPLVGWEHDGDVNDGEPLGALQVWLTPDRYSGGPSS